MSETRFDSAVVVLGMHRSGTSALTGVLRLCGLSVPSNLIPSSDANERGFWESEVVNSLNDSIFKQFGQTWRSIEAISSKSLDTKARSRIARQIAQLLSREFADGAIPLIKDPRICRLLPFWSPALAKLARRTVYPIIMRHPAEIARSLAQRNDIDFDHAVLLSARYYLDAEAATRGSPRAFVAYSALLDDWRATVHSLHAALSLPCDVSAFDEAAIDDYLSGDLRHQNTPDDMLFVEGEHMPILADAFAVFNRWASGSAECGADYDRLDEARRQLDAVGPLLSGVVERARVERKRRSVALARAEEAVANLARANRTLDDLGGLSAQLSEMASDRGLKEAVGELAASQEERLADLSRRLRKLLNEAISRADAASLEQSKALAAAHQAITSLATEMRHEAQRSTESIEAVLKSVNDRSAIETLTERHAAVEEQLGRLTVGVDERARLDAALVDALDQATTLRQRIEVVEQQEQDARARTRLHLGTIQVRDDEAAALKEQMVAVSDELKTVKRKYRSTQAILARERERLKEVRADLGSAEATLGRYRRSYPWHLYMRGTALLSGLRRLSDLALGDPAAKRRQRDIALVEQSSLFDRDWYRETYKDVAESGVDPVSHYLDNGWREGRNPGPGFSTTAYLKAHADVAAHGTNPLLHYVEYGHSEGRGAPEHSPPATKALPPRIDYGPAAPCATFTLDPEPVVTWQRAGRFEATTVNSYQLPSGLAVGALTDETRDAFERAIEQLASLSGIGELAAAPVQGDDRFQSGELIDVWYAGRNRLRSRWRRPSDSAAMVVRVLQQVDGPLEMIGETLVGDDLDLVDAKLINQYFPVLFVVCDAYGTIQGWRLLAFPSLCRGGLHHAELLAHVADQSMPTIDVGAVGAQKARQLLAIRAGTDEAFIAHIAVDLAGADGTHPLFQPNFQQWLVKVAGISVQPLDPEGGGGPIQYLAKSVLVTMQGPPRKSGGRLTLRSDMVPSLAALAARAGPGEGDASDVMVSMIVSGEEMSQPSILASLQAKSPVGASKAFASNFPILSTRKAAIGPDIVPAYAVLMPGIQALSDAELLVPVSPPALSISAAETPVTWLLSPTAWRVEELLQSLESLASQSDAGPSSIMFIGPAADPAMDLARTLFEGRVQVAADIEAARGLIRTPLVGYVGTSVILHDRRTAAVLTHLLGDERNLSSSVALVSIERRGKGFLVSPTDAGRMTLHGAPPLSPQQVTASVRMLWGSWWPTSAPPRDLWLTRTAQLADLIDMDRAAEGQGVHACSSYVTASYCSPRGSEPAAVAPHSIAAQDALQIEPVL